MRRIFRLSTLDKAVGRPERGRVLPSFRRRFNRRVVEIVAGVQKTLPPICVFDSPTALYAEI